MLKELSLTNVRIFERKEWRFPLSPLTVFCGPNSGGKSTVLKVLLLLHQNLGGTVGFGSRQGLVRFSGRVVDMGDFKTLVSRNQESLPVKIEVVIEDTFAAEYISLVEDILPPEKGVVVSDYLRSEKVPLYKLRAEFVLVDRSVLLDKSDSSSEEPSTFAAGSRLSQGVLSSAKYEITILDLPVLRWDVSANAPRRPETGEAAPAPEYRISIPDKVFKASGVASAIEPVQSNDKGYVTYRTILDGIIPVIMLGTSTRYKAPSDRSRPRKTTTSLLTQTSMPPIIYDALNDLKQHFRSIEYLGPLRSPGKRFYILSPEALTDFDAAGDFLPYILRDRKHESVVYCRPEALFESRRATLQVAINEWL